MSELICQNTMTRCQTPGMCSPHGGCRKVEPVSSVWLDRLRSEYKAAVVERDQLKSEVEALRKDKERIDALESNFWDVRHISTQVGQEGDTSESIEIVGSWMDSPRERVIGENYSENLRAAIDQAMKAPAYPPERPEYEL